MGQPHVLLLDDPLRNAGAATLYVTQDYREAMAIGDRVVILLDGTIAQLDTPEAI